MDVWDRMRQFYWSGIMLYVKHFKMKDIKLIFLNSELFRIDSKQRSLSEIEDIAETEAIFFLIFTGREISF